MTYVDTLLYMTPEFFFLEICIFFKRDYSIKIVFHQKKKKFVFHLTFFFLSLSTVTQRSVHGSY